MERPDPAVLENFKSKVLKFVHRSIFPECTESTSSAHIDKHLSFLVNKKDKQSKSAVYEYSILLKRFSDDLNTETLTEITKNLVDASASWALKLKDCKISGGDKLDLQLDKTQCFKRFVTEICNSQSANSNASPDDSVVHKTVNIVIADFLYEEELSMESLRAVLLAEHIHSLFSSRGVKCRLHYPGVSAAVKTDLELLGYSSVNLADVSTDQLTERPVHPADDVDELKENIDRLKDRLLKLSPDTSKPNLYKLSVTEYLAEEGLPRGREGYSTNIESIEIAVDDDKRLSAIAYLSSACQPSETVVHIIGMDREIRHQKFDILWRILGGSRHQRHLVVGSVNRTQAGKKLSPREFISLRRNENREASLRKRGEQKDVELEARINILTWAGIKFELLSSNARSEVKLDLSDQTASSNHRAGAFVLYNYARLANLFRQYESEVKRSVYPPLPELKDVDFSLLREQEEWDLLLHYVISYRGLVASTLPESGGVKSKIQAHKVCQFLMQLSRSLSSYYNRCHILGESRPHLYPTMYARLYLMNAVQKVLRNALCLLNIQPLEHM